MAVSFTKLSNGNVEFNNNGILYSLPSGRAVVSIDPNDANKVIINTADFSKFFIDYHNVTAPVVASRDELFNELKTNFFFELSSGNSFIDGEVATYADLPAASEHTGEAWIVTTTTGTWILGTRKSSGLYISDSVNWNLASNELFAAIQKGTINKIFLQWNNNTSQFEAKEAFTNFKAGDYENGNLFEIEADGTPVMKGDATVWDDLRVSPNSLPTLGSRPPRPEIVANDGSVKSGNAYEFNGTDSKGDVAYYSALNVTDLSISFWTKPNTLGSNEFMDRNITNGFELYNNSSYVTFALTGSNSVSSPANSLIAGAVHHIVVTARQEGANTRIKIYINNVVQVEQVVNQVIATGTGGLIIGEWKSGGWNFDGILDDIQIYNVILTDAQIAELYNNGVGISGMPTGITESTDLVARFNDSFTNVATLGAGYDMTETNITLVTGLIGSTTGSFGVGLMAFMPNVVNEIFFTAQFPHGKKLRDAANNIVGTIYPHVHWYGSDLAAGDVVWKMEYVWTQAGKSFGNTIIVERVVANDTVGDPDFANKPLQRMNNLPIDGITPPMDNESVSSTLICRLYRDGADSRDTYPGKAYLHEFDFHVEFDMTGSRNTNSK